MWSVDYISLQKWVSDATIQWHSNEHDWRNYIEDLGGGEALTLSPGVNYQNWTERRQSSAVNSLIDYLLGWVNQWTTQTLAIESVLSIYIIGLLTEYRLLAIAFARIPCKLSSRSITFIMTPLSSSFIFLHIYVGCLKDKRIGVTKGNTIQGGDTRVKLIFCGWIYKEHWTNDVERRRGWEWWRDNAVRYYSISELAPYWKKKKKKKKKTIAKKGHHFTKKTIVTFWGKK